MLRLQKDLWTYRCWRFTSGQPWPQLIYSINRPVSVTMSAEESIAPRCNSRRGFVFVQYLSNTFQGPVLNCWLKSMTLDMNFPMIYLLYWLWLCLDEIQFIKKQLFNSPSLIVSRLKMDGVVRYRDLFIVVRLVSINLALVVSVPQLIKNPW